MERIGAGVVGELGRLGPQAGMTGLLRAWPAAVGEGIAVHAWPARIARDGTLHVATSSSAWAFELTHLEATVLERLREELGERAPKALRFAPGRLPEPDAGTAPPPRPPVVTPTSAEVSHGAALAAPIEDEELRSLVARAAAVSLARGGSDR
jgi:hypothetical protein